MRLTTLSLVYSMVLLASTSAWAENSIGVRGATAMINSEVTGSGFAAQLPDAMMLNYGVTIKSKPANSSVSIILDYNLTSGNQDAPTGLSPSEISVTRQSLSIEALTEPIFTTSWGSFHAGVGYKMVDYSAAPTTPNVALTSLNLRGLTTSLKLKNDFANKADSAEGDLRLFFPHHIRESGVVTGSNPSALGAELQIKFSHAFAPQWRISVGAAYLYETIRFEGTGTRGTIDATDVRTQLTLPIELEYGF